MALELNDEQTLAVIERIIKHIEVEKNGYARVGWAIEQIMINEVDKKRYGTRDYLIKKIASLITESGKYIKDDSTVNKLAKDFDISRNPNYKPDKEDLEVQKLKMEISLLKNKLEDYRLIKFISFIGCAGSLFLIILKILEQYYR